MLELRPGRSKAKSLLFILFFTQSFFCLNSFAQVSFEDSKAASITIGKWIAKSTGHYDFLSATSVAVKRAGSKFFGKPDLQMASEYGFSYSQAPRSDEVTAAYQTIGADVSSMNDSLSLTRFHLNLGFENKHDFSLSYLTSPTDRVKGWGIGYKRVLATNHYLYLTYRLHYSNAEHEQTFKAQSLSNDLSASLYLRLIDIYVGARHWSGKVRFNSEVQQLQLPDVEFFSDTSELETYYGLMIASSTNSRLSVEGNTLAGEKMITAKFSLRFNSLLPTRGGWFRDPRHIKQ